MARHQVICITKPDVHSTHEHITHIGYAGNPRVIITVNDVIERIETNVSQFYVSTSSGTANVEVVRIPGRRPFIKTIPDHTQKDNLLSLPQC